MRPIRTKRCPLRGVQILALALLGSALCSGAAEPETASEPWVSLFNARDLTGWKAEPGKFDKAKPRPDRARLPVR